VQLLRSWRLGFTEPLNMSIFLGVLSNIERDPGNEFLILLQFLLLIPSMT